MPDSRVNVRYMVHDVDAAITFYTTHLGFTLLSAAEPAAAPDRGHHYGFAGFGKISHTKRVLPFVPASHPPVASTSPPPFRHENVSSLSPQVLQPFIWALRVAHVGLDTSGAPSVAGR
jgi:catechol 2,3-dioxygenase-like lactoylglutathione lyase family enzyme